MTNLKLQADSLLSSHDQQVEELSLDDLESALAWTELEILDLEARKERLISQIVEVQKRKMTNQ